MDKICFFRSFSTTEIFTEYIDLRIPPGLIVELQQPIINQLLLN